MIQTIKQLLPRLMMMVLIMLTFPTRAIMLYDPALGTTPGQQDWLFYFDDGFLSGGSATQSPTPGGVRLQSDLGVSGGYGNHFPFPAFPKNPSLPLLDRHLGYTLTFDLAMLDENHANTDRSGFSVTLLSSDGLGIAMNFWQDEIWAHSGADFLHAEGASISPTTDSIGYELIIHGDNYALNANGSSLLGGALRDHSAFGSPYHLPNFLFMGDNTSSAGADVILGPVELQFGTPLIPIPSAVPVPSPLWLMAGSGLLLGLVRKKRALR